MKRAKTAPDASRPPAAPRGKTQEHHAPVQPAAPSAAPGPAADPGPPASGACTLQDLCPEDKLKVSKLLKQIVELGKENQQLKEERARESKEAAEKLEAASREAAEKLGREAQEASGKLNKLHECAAQLARENVSLKGKLAQMLVVLKTYQKRVYAMDASLRANAPPQGAAARSDNSGDSDSSGGSQTAAVPNAVSSQLPPASEALLPLRAPIGAAAAAAPLPAGTTPEATAGQEAAAVQQAARQAVQQAVQQAVRLPAASASEAGPGPDALVPSAAARPGPLPPGQAAMQLPQPPPPQPPPPQPPPQQPLPQPPPQPPPQPLPQRPAQGALNGGSSGVGSSGGSMPGSRSSGSADLHPLLSVPYGTVNITIQAAGGQRERSSSSSSGTGTGGSLGGGGGGAGGGSVPDGARQSGRGFEVLQGLLEGVAAGAVGTSAGGEGLAGKGLVVASGGGEDGALALTWPEGGEGGDVGAPGGAVDEEVEEGERGPGIGQHEGHQQQPWQQQPRHHHQHHQQQHAGGTCLRCGHSNGGSATQAQLQPQLPLLQAPDPTNAAGPDLKPRPPCLVSQPPTAATLPSDAPISATTANSTLGAAGGPPLPPPVPLLPAPPSPTHRRTSDSPIEEHECAMASEEAHTASPILVGPLGDEAAAAIAARLLDWQQQQGLWLAAASSGQGRQEAASGGLTGRETGSWGWGSEGGNVPPKVLRFDPSIGQHGAFLLSDVEALGEEDMRRGGLAGLREHAGPPGGTDGSKSGGAGAWAEAESMGKGGGAWVGSESVGGRSIPGGSGVGREAAGERRTLSSIGSSGGGGGNERLRDGGDVGGGRRGPLPSSLGSLARVQVEAGMQEAAGVGGGAAAAPSASGVPGAARQGGRGRHGAGEGWQQPRGQSWDGAATTSPSAGLGGTATGFGSVLVQRHRHHHQRSAGSALGGADGGVGAGGGVLRSGPGVRALSAAGSAVAGARRPAVPPVLPPPRPPSSGGASSVGGSSVVMMQVASALDALATARSWHLGPLAGLGSGALMEPHVGASGLGRSALGGEQGWEQGAEAAAVAVAAAAAAAATAVGMFQRPGVRADAEQGQGKRGGGGGDFLRRSAGEGGPPEGSAPTWGVGGGGSWPNLDDDDSCLTDIFLEVEDIEAELLGSTRLPSRQYAGVYRRSVPLEGGEPRVPSRRQRGGGRGLQAETGSEGVWYEENDVVSAIMLQEGEVV